jgi:AcrR family transcriptional regulator
VNQIAHPTTTDEPAARIKSVALRLFADRGVDGVSVREIAAAAGQKNHNALTYHFGSKEALVRELVVDGARAIDERRNAWLDQCERSGGCVSVVQVIEGLVQTSVDPSPPPEGESYSRFVVGLHISNRSLFMDALEDRWNSGYQRCLAHIRRLMPHVPASLLNQRLVFLGAALGGILSAREGELADSSRTHTMWSHPDTLRHVAHALAGLIELSHPSEVTLFENGEK